MGEKLISTFSLDVFQVLATADVTAMQTTGVYLILYLISVRYNNNKE